MAFVGVVLMLSYKYLLKGSGLQYMITGYKLSSSAIKDRNKVNKPYKSVEGAGFDWDGLAAWIRNNGFDYDTQGSQIVGWFKGANIEATGWNVQVFAYEIKKYLSSNNAKDHWNIKVGEFL